MATGRVYSFGLFGNMNNIAINTQGVYTEKLYKKNDHGFFHGVWSLHDLLVR
jgi:hypothetical protein